uniref:Uncharacterized protein n=1 Tax=Panagrolaimus superbus TaxID=310955 RepID=A0A914YCF0_9BILA
MYTVTFVTIKLMYNIYFCNFRKLVIPNFADIFVTPNLRISFFEFLSVAVKNLDIVARTTLIETSISNFSNLLKRALVDIWTFVSPSAEMFYHGLCDLLDWYSKIFDLGLFQDSTSKKLASDCVRICTVCIDAFELSSDNLSMNTRIAELICLSFRCLSDDKKSFEVLKKKLDETTMKNNAALVILATSCLRKATACKKLLKNTNGKYVESVEESDDESDKKILILPQIRIKPCQKDIENDMILMALDLIKNSLASTSLQNIEEIKLQQFFDLLNPKLFDEEKEIFEKV